MFGITTPVISSSLNPNSGNRNRKRPIFQGQNEELNPQKMSLQMANDILERMVRLHDPENAEAIAYFRKPVSKSHSGVDLTLLNAVHSKDESLIKKQLKEKADVNQADSHGWTPLMQSCKGRFGQDLYNLIEMLLQANPNLDHQDKYGSTAVMEAVKADNLPALRKLLKLQPNLNLQDAKGKTALHHAVEVGGIEMAALLLDGGVNPDIQDAEGKRPVDWAIEQQDFQLLETLVSGNPEHQNKASYQHALDALAEMKDPEIATQMATNLLISGLNVLKPDELKQVLEYRPQLTAKGDVDSPERLWASRRNGATLLMRAAAKGNLDAVKQLIGAGVNIVEKDFAGETAFHYAKRKRHAQVATYLKDEILEQASKLIEKPAPGQSRKN
jgi:ankyrin repeat protein